MRIIANPTAGHGRYPRYLTEVQRVLKERRVDYELQETTAPGDATRLAIQAASQGIAKVVVMGGDGTIAEAANGLIGTTTALGIVSVGTGNDIARSLNLPVNKPAHALDICLEGACRKIDLGREGGRYFVSLLGVGFPASVAREANQMKRLKGSAAFFAGVYKALSGMKAFEATISLDAQVLNIRCTSIMIQNTAYTGGGLLMAPAAVLDDGLFDVVIVGAISKLSLMWNFPKVYKGRHLSHPGFSVHRSRAVRIETRPAVGKIYDGDFAGTTPVEAFVVQKALEVIVKK